MTDFFLNFKLSTYKGVHFANTILDESLFQKITELQVLQISYLKFVSNIFSIETLQIRALSLRNFANRTLNKMNRQENIQITKEI